METNDNKLLTFMETVPESPYLPVFFKTSSDNNSEHQITALGYSFIVKYSSGILNQDMLESLNTIFLKYEKEYNETNIWEVLRKILSSLTGKNKVEKVKAELNKFTLACENNFAQYKDNHEIILQKMLDATHKINRKKTMMKDYLLKNLFLQLQNLGITSEYHDWPNESIDLRKFPINEDYDIVKNKQLDIQSDADNFVVYISELIPLTNIYTFPFVYLWNSKKTRNIKKKLEDCKILDRYNRAHMMSDLEKLSKMQEALENVANIYMYTLNTFRPIMENLLSELTSKYESNFSNMPEEKIRAIMNIKSIFKKLSEANIIPQENSNEMIKSIIDYSNDLSKDYIDIKAEIHKLAV